MKDVIHHAHKMSGMDGEYEEKLFSLYSYEKAELASKELKQKVTGNRTSQSTMQLF